MTGQMGLRLTHISTLSRPPAQSGSYERASRVVERGIIKRTEYRSPAGESAAYLEEAVKMMPQIDMLLAEKKVWVSPVSAL
jgi:hypothetical protein